MRIVYMTKRGKTRKLYVPNKGEIYELNLIKRKLDWLYLSLGIPDAVHGFVHGRGCVTNAKQHRGYDHTLSMDIKDFFDSIRPHHLKVVPDFLLEKALIGGAPRQGLPTSPTLSNLALLEFDRELEWYAQFLNCMYTRYADDITLSGDLPCLKILKHIVGDLLNGLSFTLNKKKTHWQHSKGGRRIITGISVESDIRASRKSRRKLRAAVHQNNASQIHGLKEWCSCTEPMYVKWEAEGTIENPIITSTHNYFRSGRKKPTRTFRGARGVLRRYIIKKMGN